MQTLDASVQSSIIHNYQKVEKPKCSWHGEQINRMCVIVTRWHVILQGWTTDTGPNVDEP